MAQVQFRSDDTTKWGQGYGYASDGNLTVSSPTNDSPVNTTFTGSSGALTGTVGSNSGLVVGQIVLIHQSQATGNGNWMLNYIVGINGTTITFLYPLILSFGSGCQLQVIKQYQNITISNTLTGAGWNGSANGIVALMCKDTCLISGTVTQKGADSILQNTGLNGGGGGFRGGGGSNSGSGPLNESYQGESEVGTGGQSLSANASGGGGNHVGGGGGVDGTSAQTDAQLRTGFLFGGAGAGANSNSGTGATGSNGGGLILIIAPRIIITGSLNVNSGNGLVGSDNRGDAGVGAGGCILLKGQNITLGATLATAQVGSHTSGHLGDPGGGGAGASSSGGSTGVGTKGRIHADYGSSISGTTDPAIDSRQDNAIAAFGGNSFGGMI